MSKDYKNIIFPQGKPETPQNIEDFALSAMDNNTPIPQTLEYKDIDQSFKEWVEKDLYISYEGDEIGTIALFTNQRFSEYMQSWEFTDENNNMLMNFKIITRENNPKKGTMHGNNANVADNKFYLMKRALMYDKNNRPYFIDYKMKQPYCVDLIYKLSIVTNKYELLNTFNMMLNDKFKSIQCYICPRGHYIPMKLENISDESEYQINGRQFFSQSYDIRVMAYIIKDEDMIIEEQPMLKYSFLGEDGGNNAVVEFEETEEEIPLNLSITLRKNEISVKFKMCSDFHTKSIELKNVRNYKLKINDTLVTDELPTFNENDVVKFFKINKMEDNGKIILHGTKN